MKSASQEQLDRIRAVMKERRVALLLKQSEAAATAGLRLRTLQRFEQSGRIGLDKLLRLLGAYRMDRRVVQVFEDRTGWSIEELQRGESRRKVR